MKIRNAVLACVPALALITLGGCAAESGTESRVQTSRPDQQSDAGVLGLTMNRIDGTPQPLAAYRGKVVVIVNVASRCGYTRQYEDLQTLFRMKQDEGLVVLGFPANEFGSQEPGSNDEISEFCSSRFGVTFPMFEKIVVKGDGAHELYSMLADQPAPIGGEPRWNFTKFVLDRSGNVAARFEPGTSPTDEEFIAVVDRLLARDAG